MAYCYNLDTMGSFNPPYMIQQQTVLLSSDKWVDLGIGRTESGTQVSIIDDDDPKIHTYQESYEYKFD